MKRQFNIKYKKSIQNEIMRVETRDGRKARIVSWDKHDMFGRCVVAFVQVSNVEEKIMEYYQDGRHCVQFESDWDLFLVDEMLTPFEILIYKIIYGNDAEIQQENYGYVMDVARRVMSCAKDELFDKLPKWKIADAELDCRDSSNRFVYIGADGKIDVSTIVLKGQRYIMENELKNIDLQ